MSRYVAPFFKGQQLTEKEAATPCPHCSKVYHWDWEGDFFVGCKTTELKAPDTNSEPRTVRLHTCECGGVVATEILDFVGGTIYIQDRFSY